MYVLVLVFVNSVTAHVYGSAYKTEQECLLKAADIRANDSGVKATCAYVTAPH